MSLVKKLKSLLLNSSLGRTAGIFTVMNMLVSGIPFIMLPILTRYLSPSDYGIVAMYQVLEALLCPVTALGVHMAVHRQYFELEKNDLAEYVCNCFLIMLCCTCALSLAFYQFSGFISRWTGFPAQWLWTVPVTACCRTIHTTVIMLLLARVKPFPYAFFQAILVIGVVGLSLFFVVGLDMRWEGRVLGQVISFGVLAMVCIGYLWATGWLKLTIRTKHIRHALSFGAPLVPHEVGVNAISMSDRLFLTAMVGVAETGIYVVAFQVSKIVEIVGHSFKQAWMPWAYAQLKSGDETTKAKLVRITYAGFLTLITLAIVLAVVSPWILRPLVGEAFLCAAKFLLWLSLGQALLSMTGIVATYLYYVQKTSILGWIAVITLIVGVTLNYTLISIHGSIGAAEAFVLAYLVSFVLTWYKSAKEYPMPYMSWLRGRP